MWASIWAHSDSLHAILVDVFPYIAGWIFILWWIKNVDDMFLLLTNFYNWCYTGYHKMFVLWWLSARISSRLLQGLRCMLLFSLFLLLVHSPMSHEDKDEDWGNKLPDRSWRLLRWAADTVRERGQLPRRREPKERQERKFAASSIRETKEQRGRIRNMRVACNWNDPKTGLPSQVGSGNKLWVARLTYK